MWIIIHQNIKAPQTKKTFMISLSKYITIIKLYSVLLKYISSLNLGDHCIIWYFYFRKYKIKIALKEGFVSDLMQAPNILSQLQNYEISYRTSDQMLKFGPRPLISANFMNLTNIRSIEDILLHHPLFGKLLFTCN